MNVRWHEAAEAELALAVDWYEAQLPELGERFLAEAEIASRRIGELPNAWSSMRGGLRRILLDHFPWALV